MYFNADFLKNRIVLTSRVFAQRVTFAIIIISHIKVSISHRDYLPDFTDQVIQNIIQTNYLKYLNTNTLCFKGTKYNCK